jgi:hypothetical protein
MATGIVLPVHWRSFLSLVTLPSKVSPLGPVASLFSSGDGGARVSWTFEVKGARSIKFCDVVWNCFSLRALIGW